jgi:ribonuclease BN (tRNA processing enzyme)
MTPNLNRIALAVIGIAMLSVAATRQAYHSRYHTSARELGAIASRARPGVLVLYHQLMWSATEEDLLTKVLENLRTWPSVPA